ncbi:MAG: response regulator [Anaerolineae bacterium]|nr:response regulator [Anaerolineae bacterium]
MLIWGLQALLYGMLLCITEMIDWSWSSYENMRDLLDKARDQQLALRQAQADLVHANIQLARLSERLDAMRHIAEEARRVKEEFLANVSHELRTPLNMIIGFSEMITGAPDAYGGVPSELLADLEVILANSRHLASLVDDVLDLSQADAGRMVLSKEWVPVRDLVTSAIAAVRPLFTSKGLYLEHSVSCDVEVFCDRTRIRQVLVNLLSNAGRYTKEGGARLDVVLRGRDVVISVADTGPGIDPKDQERVFLPFEQASTGAVGGKGSGLGLAISKRFVEMHGGRIWLESEVGKGSTFYVSLPTVEPPPLRSDWSRWINPYAAYEPNERRSSRDNLNTGPRFVVVEQGKSLQRFVARHCPSAEVVPAPSIEEALAELTRAPAHAVIVNDERYQAVPPGVTELGGLPLGTPVIGCWVPDKHEAAERLGVVDYLLKPVTRDRLLSALDSLGRPIRSLLLVDDEFDALQLFGRMLEGAGRDYRVYRANDGQRALAHLRRYRPDVMLLDLVMPGMDGYTLLAEKNADDSIRDIPVIALSAQDPMRGSTMPNSLTITRTGGLDPRDLVNCLRAVASLLQPASSSVGPASQETTGETRASSGS